MLILPKDETNQTGLLEMNGNTGKYYAALILCIITCALAGGMAFLRAALINWVGSDEGVTALQQAANGLALTALTITAGIIVNSIGKGGNGTDGSGTKSDSK